MPTKRCLVPAVKRAFDVVELLSQHTSGLTISELHRRLKLPISSVANLLYTLNDLGYVERDEDGSRYTVGTKFLSLGRQIVDGVDLVGRCRSLLEELALKTGATAHLAVVKGNESVYIDRAAGNGLVQIRSYIGMRWPVQVSAVGKAILAFMPQDQQDRLISTIRFSRMTSATVTSREALKKQLAEIRELGYASEFGEGEEGMACVAAPVFGHDDALLAGISLSGTVFQLTKNEIPQFGDLVSKYARRMSERLGQITRPKTRPALTV